MPAFAGPRTNFLYPHLCVFALLASAYVVPTIAGWCPGYCSAGNTPCCWWVR